MRKPEIPATPKPGITKTSNKIINNPPLKINISVEFAKPTNKCDPKNKDKQSKPSPPGTPKPGDLISKNTPIIPKLMRIGANDGFVRNLTNNSDHVSFTSTTLFSAILR